MKKILSTPYYLIDERKLLKNLRIIASVKKLSGAKSVLALKCFSSWCVFDLMKKYMDGTTSSSLYETRLGFEKFGKETHAYSVAYTLNEINEIKKYAEKIIFNSVSQLEMFYEHVKDFDLGLRINPQLSYSHFDLADPARRFSRLGAMNVENILACIDKIRGLMFHFNCENNDFNAFAKHIKIISNTYSALLRKVDWVSLGGGISFTQNGYPLDRFVRLLKNFAQEFKVQVYLEPGESAITQSAQLVTSVLDIIHNEIDIAVVDSSTEAHMLDLLIYRTQAKLENADQGKFKYMIAGRSCLAGDIFGTYHFNKPLKIGSRVTIEDAAGYTIVKKNWFNGLSMPSIVVKKLNGKLDFIRKFSYNDFVRSVS